MHRVFNFVFGVKRQRTWTKAFQCNVVVPMESIHVAARVRPPLQDGEACISADTEAGLITITGKNKLNQYEFSSVFDQNSSQDLVYAQIAKHVVDGFVTGINGTIFAYGQTGSGKTYTMLGDFGKLSTTRRGIVPRAVRAVFQYLEDKKTQDGKNFNYKVSLSFLELYNERVYDLLSNCEMIEYREIESRDVPVHSSDECVMLIQLGWTHRKVGATAMNLESSRSHAILTLQLTTMLEDNGIMQQRSSRLHLVDLAGSERQSDTNVFGERLREACSINKSLSTLCQVIRTLSNVRQDTKPFVNYRDSLLTRMLQEALGGNSRTAVIVNLHAMPAYYNDSISTLRFACNVAKIKTNAKINENVLGVTADVLTAKIIELQEALRVSEEKVRCLTENKVYSSQPPSDYASSVVRERYEATQHKLTLALRNSESQICQLKTKVDMLAASNQFLVNNTTIINAEELRRLHGAMENRLLEVAKQYAHNTVDASNLDVYTMQTQMDNLKREVAQKNETLEQITKKYEILTEQLLDLNNRFPRNGRETGGFVLSPAVTPVRNLRRRTLFVPSAPSPDAAVIEELQKKNNELTLKVVDLEQIVVDRSAHIERLQNAENEQLSNAVNEMTRVYGELDTLKKDLKARTQEANALNEQIGRLRVHIQRSDALVVTLQNFVDEITEHRANLENELAELRAAHDVLLSQTEGLNKSNDENVPPAVVLEYERRLADAKIQIETNEGQIAELRDMINVKDISINAYKRLRRRSSVDNDYCVECENNKKTIYDLNRQLDSAGKDLGVLADELDQLRDDAAAKSEADSKTIEHLKETNAWLTKEKERVARELCIVVSTVLESTITPTETRFSVFGPGSLSTNQSDFNLVVERLKQQRRTLMDKEFSFRALEDEVKHVTMERDEFKTKLQNSQKSQKNFEELLERKTTECDNMMRAMCENSGHRNAKQGIHLLEKMREKNYTLELELFKLKKNCNCSRN